MSQHDLDLSSENSNKSFSFQEKSFSNTSKIKRNNKEETELTPKAKNNFLDENLNLPSPETFKKELDKKKEEFQENFDVAFEKYPDGSFFEGSIINGKRDGLGLYVFANGGCYNGQWKNDCMHGYGMLYYPDSKLAYYGEWKWDRLHGRGILWNDNFNENSYQTLDYSDFNKLESGWTHYQGMFDNNEKNGEGTMYFSEGEIYHGQFLSNKIHGNGKIILNHIVITGIWRESKLIKILN